VELEGEAGVGTGVAAGDASGPVAARAACVTATQAPAISKRTRRAIRSERGITVLKAVFSSDLNIVRRSPREAFIGGMMLGEAAGTTKR
jgi:hypothetical protein